MTAWRQKAKKVDTRKSNGDAEKIKFIAGPYKINFEMRLTKTNGGFRNRSRAFAFAVSTLFVSHFTTATRLSAHISLFGWIDVKFADKRRSLRLFSANKGTPHDSPVPLSPPTLYSTTQCKISFFIAIGPGDSTLFPLIRRFFRFHPKPIKISFVANSMERENSSRKNCFSAALLRQSIKCHRLPGSPIKQCNELQMYATVCLAISSPRNKRKEINIHKSTEESLLTLFYRNKNNFLCWISFMVQIYELRGNLCDDSSKQ